MRLYFRGHGEKQDSLLWALGSLIGLRFWRALCLGS